MNSTTLQQELENLSKLLETSGHPQSFNCLVGFDGFVDEIIDVVNKRDSFDSYQRLETIEEFGARISRASGLSTNIELVPRTVKLGGNGPIMANALLSAGAVVDYIGALGEQDIHPVFKEMVSKCHSALSIANPGHTDALEFSDGKVMLGKLMSLNDVNWENLMARVGREELSELLSQAGLIATVNWTMTPYMTDIWENLLKLVPSGLEPKPMFFIDLADPEKRKDEDIRHALQVIEKFSDHFRVILGLNRKEASEIARVLGLKLTASNEAVSLEEITKEIGKHLDIWCLMVHPTNAAAAICEGEYAYTPGPFTSRPKLTTGAGDNFNAGFCLGLLLGLPLQKALMLGTATSGYYVRNMHSPEFGQVQDFVKLWASKAGEDF